MEFLQVLAFFFVLAAPIAMAQDAPQDAPQDASRQSERILRDRAAQEKQKAIEKKKIENKLKPNKSESPPPQSDAIPDESCKQISVITVKGVTLLSDDDIQAVLLPYHNKCLGITEFNTILKQVTYLYVEKGYITSRALLPEQDLSDHTLEIVVVEGYLERITIDGDEENYKSQIQSAFPGMIGEPLNLRDIEQGLDQLNRLQLNNSQIKLIPAEKPNATVLEVTRNQTDFFNGIFTTDNLGATSTGQYQFNFNFNFEDLYGHNDTWGLSYQRTSIFHPLYFSKVPRSDFISMNASIPYGYWAFDFDAYISNYQSTIAGVLNDIPTSGTSRNVTLNTSVVVERDQTSITKLSASLTWKEAINFIAESRVDISSRKLTIGTFEILYTNQIPNGQFFTSVSYNNGLPLLHAFSDETAPLGSPKGQFKSLNVFLNAYVSFLIEDVASSFNWQFSGQYSPDLLFGSEQVAYGSYATVRGLRESVIFGNNGVLMRNELTLRYAPSTDAEIVSAIGVLENYISLDYGLIPRQAQYQIPKEYIAGLTLGLRLRGGIFGIDVSYSDIISYSKPLTERVEDSGMLSIIVSTTF